jgi:hypothetical protein
METLQRTPGHYVVIFHLDGTNVNISVFSIYLHSNTLKGCRLYPRN